MARIWRPQEYKLWPRRPRRGILGCDDVDKGLGQQRVEPVEPTVSDSGVFITLRRSFLPKGCHFTYIPVRFSIISLFKYLRARIYSCCCRYPDESNDATYPKGLFSSPPLHLYTKKSHPSHFLLLLLPKDPIPSNSLSPYLIPTNNPTPHKPKVHRCQQFSKGNPTHFRRTIRLSNWFSENQTNPTTETG